MSIINPEGFSTEKMGAEMDVVRARLWDAMELEKKKRVKGSQVVCERVYLAHKRSLLLAVKFLKPLMLLKR